MSKHDNRYTVPTEEGFEPGSNGEVLKNYAKVTSKAMIDALEQSELERVSSTLVADPYFGQGHQFTALDICAIHELWLGDVYGFAGQYRTVMMSKSGFPFAAPAQIPQLMLAWEADCLSHYTPCHFSEIDELAYALAVVHVELILIHPFREGNGRVARLLSDLMVMQADRQPLDFTPIEPMMHKKGFNQYIAAIHKGLDKEYEAMQSIFKTLLHQANVLDDKFS